MGMSRCVARSVAVVLAVSLILAPAAQAQEAAGSAPRVPTGTAVDVSATGLFDQDASSVQQRKPLPEDWWKLAADFSYSDLSSGSPLWQQQAAAPEKTWSHSGKIMTGIGLAVAGIGAVMLVAGPERDPNESGFFINWQATGAIWIGGGTALAIIGLTRKS